MISICQLYHFISSVHVFIAIHFIICTGLHAHLLHTSVLKNSRALIGNVCAVCLYRIREYMGCEVKIFLNLSFFSLPFGAAIVQSSLAQIKRNFREVMEGEKDAAMSRER